MILPNTNHAENSTPSHYSHDETNSATATIVGLPLCSMCLNDPGQLDSVKCSNTSVPPYLLYVWFII